MLFARTALGAGAVVAAVVGEVMFGAISTLVKSPAEFGGAAREDAPHGSIMGGG